MNLFESLFSLPFFAQLGLAVLIGASLRAAQGRKVPILSGLLTAISAAFVTFLVVILLRYLIGLAGIVPPTDVIVACGGLLAWLGNYVVAGVEHQGRKLEDGGFADLLDWLIKFLTGLKGGTKTPQP